MATNKLLCHACDNYIIRNSDSGSTLGYCEHVHKADMGITMSAARKTGTCKGYTPFVPRLL